MKQWIIKAVLFGSGLWVGLWIYSLVDEFLIQWEFDKIAERLLKEGVGY